MYDYKEGKKRIFDILNSKTKIEELDNIPKADEKFTYENGIRAWTSAIFVDIVNSSALLKSKDEKLARLMRAFVSELITIMKSNDNQRQIGIRGDCVYGIYSTKDKPEISKIYDMACMINTFMIMFNKIIQKNDYDPISVGIGLGCDEELIIKAGKENTGINDIIWIGKAVIDASNFSSMANRNGYKPIMMNKNFYDKIINIQKNEPFYHDYWFNHFRNNNGEFYTSGVVYTEFTKWLETW